MGTLNDIIEKIFESKKFKEAIKCNKIEGLHGSLKAFFIVCLAKKWDKICVITKEPEELFQNIQVWNKENQKSKLKKENFKDRVFCIPELDSEEELESMSMEIRSEILTGLSMLLKWGTCNSKVATNNRGIIVSASIEKLPLPEVVNRKSLIVNRRTEIDMDDLVQRLSGFGFKRVGTVEEIGEFAVRGGILDLWGYGMKNPMRIEWFGDEITSIREFDSFMQTSLNQKEEIKILSMNLKSGGASIVNYLSEDTLLVSDGIQFQDTNRANTIHLREGYPVNSESSYQGNIRVFTNTIKELKAKKFKIFITCENKTQDLRVLEILNRELLIRSNEKLTQDESDNLHNHKAIQNIEVRRGSLSSGFILPDAKLAVFTYSDILGYKIRLRRQLHPFIGSGVSIQDLTTLKTGDFIVNIDRGIGIYQCLERVEVDNNKMDCLVILYKGGDKLYVPVDKFNLIERWVGSNGNPELTKLDSSAWERKKERIKKGIQDLTREFLALYAERKIRKGYQFSPDTIWQSELEVKFPYEETEGQLEVIEKVKQDMESEYPMEHLVCGEVGYGKTEVALRAAFKAVMNEKQVAILCPTTILVEQHIRTFRDRLADFPVRVEQLSRFQNKKEQQKIVELLGNGVIDIVIGTHRLNSKDVNFKDLGLLIIDEEHKFGVLQKEKLKHMRKNLDILSLTATPIPRSLHMSLAGIREISEIKTPPIGRKPIVTKVSFWDENLIEQAILREVESGGQVYFLHNRIKSIEAIANVIQRMNSKFEIGIAHAELSVRELERVMFKFLNKEINVLITTAIIGSGIDIPGVNTIIINRADRFGLAELHQLRGRVGRSEKHAYCYLIVSRHMAMEAKKRIQVIAMHTELGAGFKIAMRDLEMRGTGNLLGKEQHGYIHTLGYELYTKLLEETIRTMKGEKIEKEIEPELKLGVNCYIPDSYVDPRRKLTLYKRLAGFRDETCIDTFKDELIDRFGKLPDSVKSLLLVAQIKILARKRKIIKIQNTNGYEFIFAKLPDELWFNKNKISYVEPRKEGIGIGIQVKNLDELKKVLH